MINCKHWYSIDITSFSTDIVTMDNGLRTLTVFIYSHGKICLPCCLNLVKDSFSFWPFTSLSFNNNIASIIPADYNYDGQLDLLVITVDSSEDPNTYLNYFFRTQTGPYFFGTEEGQPDQIVPISGQSQPFVLDTQGDRR